jgi:transposase
MFSIDWLVLLRISRRSPHLEIELGMSFKKYRPWDPDRVYLFPPAMGDWLEQDHQVYRLLDVMDALDIRSVTHSIHGKDARGTRPYNPRMMLALLFYSYSNGIYSSREIAAATRERVDFRVLTGDQHPFHTVINEFRLRHLEALPALFIEVLKLCDRAGLMKLEHVSLDGTKVNANASKHKAMSHGRMESEIERLEGEIQGLLFKADAIDAKEDELYGKGKEAHAIPEELKSRQKRLEAIRKAKEELEEEARHAKAEELRERAKSQRDAAETEEDPTERKRKLTRAQRSDEKADRLEGKQDEVLDPDTPDDPDDDLPSHRVPTTRDGSPTPKAQRNFTDSDSRIMRRNGSFLQGYNCQVVADEADQLILAEGVTNQAPDQEHLIPMMDRVKSNTGRSPSILTADTGYMSEDNVAHCEGEGIDAYIAVGRDKHGTAPPERDEPRDDESQAWSKMRAKLATEDGKQLYSRRKVIVEPVFGQIKEPRGFRRFSLRGLVKVRREWTLVCLCHNLMKLVKAQSAAAVA